MRFSLYLPALPLQVRCSSSGSSAPAPLPCAPGLLYTCTAALHCTALALSTTHCTPHHLPASTTRRTALHPPRRLATPASQPGPVHLTPSTAHQQHAGMCGHCTPPPHCPPAWPPSRPCTSQPHPKPKPSAPSCMAMPSLSASCALLSYSGRSSWLKHVWALGRRSPGGGGGAGGGGGWVGNCVGGYEGMAGHVRLAAVQAVT